MAGDPFTAAIFRWLNAVAADASLPPAAFKLGYVISQHINRQSREAWPSQETLRESVGLKDERSVRRLTVALEARGFLITRRRKRMSMIYRLAQDRTELSYQEEQTGSDNADARPDNFDRTTDQDRTFLAARPDNFAHQDRTELSAKPLIEPLNEPERGRRARAKPLPNDFGLDQETNTWAVSRLGSADAVYASMFKFENHHRSKGNRFVDWMARARLWIEDDARDAEKAIADDKSVVTAAKRLSEKLSSFDAGPSAVVLSTDEWRKALTLFQRTGTWSKYVDVYGSAPPSPDCKAPRHLLIEFGLLREDAA